MTNKTRDMTNTPIDNVVPFPSREERLERSRRNDGHECFNPREDDLCRMQNARPENLAAREGAAYVFDIETGKLIDVQPVGIVLTEHSIDDVEQVELSEAGLDLLRGMLESDDDGSAA